MKPRQPEIPRRPRTHLPPGQEYSGLFSIFRMLKPWAWYLLGAGALVVGWVIAAWVIDASIILPGPELVLRRLGNYMGQSRFWSALGGTVIRVLAGFGLSLAVATVLGGLAGVFPGVRWAITPLLRLVQAVPVLAVILIALIWFGSEQVPVFTAVLMGMPVMTEGVIQGVRGADPGLVEMARAYRVPGFRIFTGIQLPSALPFLAAAARASLGLTWKVVVAAEVLAQPIHGIGTGMQGDKIILETPGVLAWTAAAVVLSAVSQGVFSLVLRGWRRYGRG